MTGEGTTQKAAGGHAPRPGQGEGQESYRVIAGRHPLRVQGTAAGLPFCLVEEDETWRFVLGREKGLDPLSVRTDREGFIVTGVVGKYAADEREMPPARIFHLVQACLEVLCERKRRAKGAVETRVSKRLRGERRVTRERCQ